MDRAKQDNTYTSFDRPKQRVSKKVKETKEWKEANNNYWISRCNSFYHSKDVDILYKAAAGKLDESDYTYVTNPLGSDNPKLQGYPSKMRNVDILSGNITTLLGELISRYFNPMAIAINADNKNKQYEQELSVRVDYFMQEFVNELVQQGLAPEEISKQQEPLEVKLKKVLNLKDEYAIIGQNALDYIRQFNSVDLIRRKTFYDLIVSSSMFTYRDICMEDTDYEYCHPKEMSWLSSPNIDFIEDCMAVKREKTMSISQLIDKFSDLEDFREILPQLENMVGISSAVNMPYYYGTSDIINTQELLNKLTNTPTTILNSESFILQHVQWTGMKKMFKVNGVDDTGTPYEIHVDEDYIVDDTREEAEEYWINEKMESYKIADIFVIGTKPLEYQRGSYNNPSKCKNSYNGRIFLGNYITPQSIVERGLVYQIKYNVIHYYLEMVLAKNMDKIILLPLGLIPDKEGWDEFTIMYYAKALGFLFVDESDPKVQLALSEVKVLDASLSNYIKDIYGLLRQIKADWDESCGVNDNRKGQGAASEGKAVNEERIYRGTMITEELFQEHEETIIKDLQCLVDLSKAAWQNGKKANFLSSDFKLIDLDIDPTIYQQIDLGVFIQNSGQAKKDMDMVKSQIGAIAQQTSQLNMIPRIAQATNMSKLIEQMDEMVFKLEEQEQAAKNAENELAKQQIEDKQKDRDLIQYEVDKKDDTERYKIDSDKEVSLIDNQTKLLLGSKFTDGDFDNDNIPDVLEIEKLQQKREEANAYINLEVRKLNEQKAKRQQDSKEKEKDRLSKEKIARNKPKPSSK